MSNDSVDKVAEAVRTKHDVARYCDECVFFYKLECDARGYETDFGLCKERGPVSRGGKGRWPRVLEYEAACGRFKIRSNIAEKERTDLMQKLGCDPSTRKQAACTCAQPECTRVHCDEETCTEVVLLRRYKKAAELFRRVCDRESGLEDSLPSTCPAHTPVERFEALVELLDAHGFTGQLKVWKAHKEVRDTVWKRTK